ncbi:MULTISPECIES: hypothetical protein [Lysinibacillus]|nr:MULTISPECIES: hypothetical protein [Lysinibacillus]
MIAIQRLTEVLEQKLGKEISIHEVGYETIVSHMRKLMRSLYRFMLLPM